MVFTNAAGGINLSYARGRWLLMPITLTFRIEPAGGPGGEGLGRAFRT